MTGQANMTFHRNKLHNRLIKQNKIKKLLNVMYKFTNPISVTCKHGILYDIKFIKMVFTFFI